MSKPVLEYSEDRRRGALPHLQRAIEEVRSSIGNGVRCARCRLRQATHLIDNCRQAVCGPCALQWAAATPLARRQARGPR
jgi:hypothetical protein